MEQFCPNSGRNSKIECPTTDRLYVPAMTVTQAVCLVGGRGTRLGTLTDSTPKPLLEVGGRPFLDYLVHEARRFGLTRLTLLSGYQSGEIERRYDSQRFGQLTVEVVPESEPAGGARLGHRARRPG